MPLSANDKDPFLTGTTGYSFLFLIYPPTAPLHAIRLRRPSRPPASRRGEIGTQPVALPSPCPAGCVWPQCLQRARQGRCPESLLISSSHAPRQISCPSPCLDKIAPASDLVPPGHVPLLAGLPSSDWPARHPSNPLPTPCFPCLIASPSVASSSRTPGVAAGRHAQELLASIRRGSHARLAPRHIPDRHPAISPHTHSHTRTHTHARFVKGIVQDPLISLRPRHYPQSSGPTTPRQENI